MTQPERANEFHAQSAAHPDADRVSGLYGSPATSATSPDCDDRVVVVEVGPRDGLQNEPVTIPTTVKIDFVNALSAAGFPVIEATSFVNPRAVPQLADAADLMAGIDRRVGTRYLALVPNEKGLERALAAGTAAIAVFTSATEAFAESNVGTSIAGTFDRFEPVAAAAREQGIWMRGYVSVAFGCPYSGEVSVGNVISVVERLLNLGCEEICLADTIGVAKPDQVKDTLGSVKQSIPASRLALHFHDTSGTALDNVATGLQAGLRIFDAAAGGLGGCPFAPGAPGNLSTERLLERLDRLGLRTGIAPQRITEALTLLRPYVSRLAVSAA